MIVASMPKHTTPLISQILELGGTCTVNGLSKEQFKLLASLNPELQMEREKNGKINIMASVKGGSGWRENTINYRVRYWREIDGKGMCFSPSTGFELPNGAIKSPDTAARFTRVQVDEEEKMNQEQLIECIPNFSEGRNPTILQAIANAIKSIEDVQLLHIDQGEAANRTVFTFIGPPKLLLEAAFRAIQVASELIDMRQQQGAHPRIGACDVCPLVPLANISMEEVQRYAEQLGQRVGDALDIPVYLYENSAMATHRKNLATIRSGEYEGFAQKMKSPKWQPDFGPLTFNPTTGATVLGARDFLIAYNVNLNTKDVSIANEIARSIRASGRVLRFTDGTKTRVAGKLTYVKAIGWYIEEYDKAQVSMNLTNIHQMGIHEAYLACVEAAESLGVQVTGSELIGLIPEQALVAAGRYFLLLEGKSTDDLTAIVDAAIEGLGLAELAPFVPEERIIARRFRRIYIDFAD